MAVAMAAATEGARVRELREDLGLSRNELARRALIDPGTVWRLETGRPVSDLTRRRIAAALDKTEPVAA